MDHRWLVSVPPCQSTAGMARPEGKAVQPSWSSVAQQALQCPCQSALKKGDMFGFRPLLLLLLLIFSLCEETRFGVWGGGGMSILNS